MEKLYWHLYNYSLSLSLTHSLSLSLLLSFPHTQTHILSLSLSLFFSHFLIQTHTYIHSFSPLVCLSHTPHACLCSTMCPVWLLLGNSTARPDRSQSQGIFGLLEASLTSGVKGRFMQTCRLHRGYNTTVCVCVCVSLFVFPLSSSSELRS